MCIVASGFIFVKRARVYFFIRSYQYGSIIGERNALAIVCVCVCVCVTCERERACGDEE